MIRPCLRAFARIAASSILLLAAYATLTAITRMDDEFLGKLDEVTIPDMQIFTLANNNNSTARTLDRKLAFKEFSNNGHGSEQAKRPDTLLNDFSPADLWSTNSLDEVVPDKYVSITGTRRINKGFLTIGIPSIKRSNGVDITYLSDTLKSLIENCSPQDKNQVVILLFLADFDKAYTSAIKAQIVTLYEPYLKSGFIQVMEVDPGTYPILTGLKQNFKDETKRVSWRAKQCIDFAYMFHYARNLSDFYLQLEDDVQSAPNYVTEIHKFIYEQKKPWISLQFSVLGFIGKLFRSSDLEQFARFLKLFYQEMPVDWLYPIFAKLLSYPNLPIRKPTLFQHMGKISSLNIKKKQKLNLLKDKYFKSKTVDASKQLQMERPANPPAALYTTLQTYHSNKPIDAYMGNNKKYFWGQEPNLNDTFTIIFVNPQRLKAIQIETGHPEKGIDFLREGLLISADLQVGTRQQKQGNSGENICNGNYKTIGSLVGGSIFETELEKSITEPVHCVRLLVTGAQIDWVIIHTISIWVAI